MAETLNAQVTVRFSFCNICRQQDLDDCEMTLHEMVETLIEEEGLMGCVDGEFEIVKVRELKYDMKPVGGQDD